MQKRGYHDFPSKIFLSHSTEKLRRGTLLCFRKILVSKIFLHKRGEALGFSVVLIKLKILVKAGIRTRTCRSQNPVVLPTVPWEQLETLTNVSEIIKISDTTETRTRTYCLRSFFLTPCLDSFLNRKI